MHHLILGSTGFGKTSLAAEFIREAQREGRPALVLDPFRGTDWPGLGGPLLEVRTDPREYLELVKTSRNCLAVMDESGDEGCRPIVDEIVRKARHWGTLCVTVVHRAPMVSPTVRYCSLGGLWAFRLRPPGVEMLEKEYGELPGLRLALRLTRYRCLRWDPCDLSKGWRLHRTRPLTRA